MKNILFYNLWHNGDVFSGRGYIKEIINSIPNAKFGYYHKNNPKVVMDLVTTKFKPDLSKWQVEQLNFRKIFETDQTIYINTWVGTYFHQHATRMQDFPDVVVNLPNEGHANYLSLHKMYRFIINYLNEIHSCNITLSDDPLDYVPEIDWSTYYDIEPANDFAIQTKGMARHLFCNGKVRSNQSALGDMSNIVQALAQQNPKDAFICTEVFKSSLPNIFFSKDIFNIPCDLNEIAYLSTFCDTIVGKNSGPFMFTHHKHTINNEAKVFVAFSNHVSDCYPYHMKNLPCKYIHSSTSSELTAFEIVRGAISLTKGSIASL